MRPLLEVAAASPDSAVQELVSPSDGIDPMLARERSHDVKSGQPRFGSLRTAERSARMQVQYERAVVETPALSFTSENHPLRLRKRIDPRAESLERVRLL